MATARPRTLYEATNGVKLPLERCGYSEGDRTCTLEAWHDRIHHMVPVRLLVPRNPATFLTARQEMNVLV